MRLLADNIIETKEFSAFMSAAKKFCSFIETDLTVNGNDFIVSAKHHLVSLYFSGLTLPEVELEIGIDIDCADLEMKPVLKSIGERVPFSYYWMVLNPFDPNKLADIGAGDLIDDLGDIYKDLKRALILFESNDFGAKEHAVWMFKFDFESHWEQHCVEALYAIQNYLQNK